MERKKNKPLASTTSCHSIMWILCSMENNYSDKHIEMEDVMMIFCQYKIAQNKKMPALSTP